MENERDELVRRLTRVYNDPGGTQAIRFIMKIFSALPTLGSPFSAIANIIDDVEQQNFVELITDIVRGINDDLNKVLTILEAQLIEPTKPKLALLLGEVLNVELPQYYPEDMVLQVAAILHNETLAEFKPFEKIGWIVINPHGSVALMGANNRIGNLIEDRKRPWGMGMGLLLQLKRNYMKIRPT